MHNSHASLSGPYAASWMEPESRLLAAACTIALEVLLLVGTVAGLIRFVGSNAKPTDASKMPPMPGAACGRRMERN